jgi:hypothetical protein
MDYLSDLLDPIRRTEAAILDVDAALPLRREEKETPFFPGIPFS